MQLRFTRDGGSDRHDFIRSTSSYLGGSLVRSYRLVLHGLRVPPTLERA